MSGEVIRDSFTATLADQGNFLLKFSQYRDLAVAFERVHRRSNPANDHLSFMAAMQGGHTEATEDMVYGRGGREHLNQGADWEWDTLAKTKSS